MNITNTIWRNCEAYPGSVAIVYEGRPIRYKQLRDMAETTSARPSAAGIAPGDVVALSLENRFAYVVVLLALLRIGAIATPLAHQQHRDELIVRNRVRAIVWDKDDGWRGDSLPASRLLDVRTLFAPLPQGERLEMPQVVQGLDEQPWIIPLTSGTTGAPKGNPHTHARGILAILLWLWSRTGQLDMDRVLPFVGLGVQYAISTVFQILYIGKTVILTRLVKPPDFFAAVRSHQPTLVLTTTGMAAVLADYAAKNVADSAEACGGIRSIIVAGSALTSTMREGIAARICPRLEVHYGSTEAGSLAVETPETHATHPASAGRLNDWVYAEAVDENDRPVPEGKIGLLRFKSLLMTGGYVGDEQATGKVFRNGWFYPGDRGAVRSGYLFLRGRIDDVVNVGGNKIDPAPIEKLLDEDPAIVESAVIASVDQGTGMPILVAVVVAQAPFDAATLKRKCLDSLGKKHMPQAIVQIDALPRNDGGKVMRKELSARLSISSKKQQE